jgi:ABC-type polysaccharide/polyol phosphate transport system ATPase subunit
MNDGEIMLEVKNISKGFRLRENQADSLKGMIAQLFTAKPPGSQNFQALKNVSFNLHKG